MKGWRDVTEGTGRGGGIEGMDARDGKYGRDGRGGAGCKHVCCQLIVRQIWRGVVQLACR